MHDESLWRKNAAVTSGCQEREAFKAWGAYRRGPMSHCAKEAFDFVLIGHEE